MVPKLHAIKRSHSRESQLMCDFLINSKMWAFTRIWYILQGYRDSWSIQLHFSNERPCRRLWHSLQRFQRPPYLTRTGPGRRGAPRGRRRSMPSRSVRSSSASQQRGAPSSAGRASPQPACGLSRGCGPFCKDIATHGHSNYTFTMRGPAVGSRTASSVSTPKKRNTPE